MFLAAVCCSLASTAAAHSFTVKGLDVDHPFATPTVASAPTGAVYLSIANRNKTPDRLVSATTPRAKRVELHSMRMDGDIMRMRQVKGYDIPAQGSFELSPNGAHLMLVDLKQPLKEGDKVPVTLKFEHAGEVNVQFQVRALAAAPPHHMH